MISTRIIESEFRTDDFLYRTPIKFGGVALDRVTLLTVTMTVETNGKVATGSSSMPLGNVWAWPSKELPYEMTLSMMKTNAELCCNVFFNCHDVNGHPLEITHRYETEFLRTIGTLPPIMPILAALVTLSPFDAALHDAYAKSLGRNCYDCYGPDCLKPDLSHFLGNDFKGERLTQYLRPTPRETLPLYHLVGALDPLTPADITKPINDGLPEALGDWIITDGLTHLKIKLNGDDLTWDLDRVAGVHRVANDTAPDRDWHYSLDFNERCQDVASLVEFLHRLKSTSPQAYDRVQYIEQPTARDLKANPHNRMHEAAKLKPVVIDESLVDLESLRLAQELGYTGVAFKACKGQTQTLLLAAAAQKAGLFLCVQDLTCPGAALIHSASLAARIPGIAAIEANARQYCPAANAGWDEKYPGIFTIRNGVMRTGQLTGLGLG